MRASATRGNLLTRTAADVLIRLPISHYCRKVEWAFRHVGHPYAVSDVWFRTLVDFQDMNPENTVPVLIADGHRITGSSDILGWLAEQHPEADLYPSAAVEAWEAWADETIGPWARRVAYRTIHARPTHYTRNPALWALFRGSRGLVLNILKHSKARRFEDQDAADGPEILSRVATQLTGPYLFGERPTAADFATAALLEPVFRIRREPITRHAAWADLQAYVKRVRRRGRSPKLRWTPERRAAWAALPQSTRTTSLP